jgi:predicted nucleotidyltransferase
MPIPDLLPNGLLPEGVHDATSADVRERFGRFRETAKRVELQTVLDAFLAEAQASGLVEAIIVNGSYTTGKAQPEDIDIIVVLRQGVDLAAELRPDQYNVVSANRVKKRYPFDVRVATSAPETLRPLVDFFAEVKQQPGLRKGMVKVTL